MFHIWRCPPAKFASAPSIATEESDAVADANKVKITWKAKTVTVEGIKYAFRQDTGELYDLESFKSKNPVLVGNLEKVGADTKSPGYRAKLGNGDLRCPETLRTAVVTRF